MQIAQQTPSVDEHAFPPTGFAALYLHITSTPDAANTLHQRILQGNTAPQGWNVMLTKSLVFH